MADQSLPPRPSYVVLTLARQSARNAVKEQLRAQGLRPQSIRTREINCAADSYLKEHARELLEEAWRKVQGCPDLMKFYTKEMKDRQRKTVHTPKQSMTTCPARSEIS